MRRPQRGLGLALCLALAPAAQAGPLSDLDAYASRLQAELARLGSDPFDPESLAVRRQALLASQAGQELRIPAPPKSMDRVGAGQGLWPLRYQDGRLRLEFSTGNSLSYTAVIGFVALIGIEIKNSRLLVDFTTQLREAGRPLLDAIEEAGEVRFLPVLLTSVTAIGGDSTAVGMR